MLLTMGIIVGFIGLLAILPMLKRLSLDYQFTASESWTEACLGDEDAVRELLNWQEANAERPSITVRGYAEYQCEWAWESGSAKGGGQVLTMTIEVRESGAFGSEDSSFEESLATDNLLAQEDWRVDYETLKGWEHGICRQSFSERDSSYECIASASNLRLTVSSRDLSTGTDYEDKYFGPGTVSVEDITVAVGETVRAAFRK